MPGRNRAHYAGDYRVRAKRVTDAAKADPSTRCWRPDCRRTMAEVRALHPGKRVFWTAGHVRDGDPFSALLPECSPCNFSHGQALSAAKSESSGGTGRI